VTKLHFANDALTRRPGDLPEGGDARLGNMEQVVLKPQNLPEQLRLLADSPPVQFRPSIPDLMAKGYKTDPSPGRIWEAIRMKSGLQEITIAECIQEDGQVRYRGSLYVLDDDELRLHIIQQHHDTALARHLGQGRGFTTCIESTIGRKCEKMSTGMYGIVMITNSPAAHDIQPVGSFHLYLYRINHGTRLSWTLSWKYR